MKNISDLKKEIKQIFFNNIGINIETQEQEEQTLFYFNSELTPARSTLLFAILYSRYNINLSDIVVAFKNEMTFTGIVNYVFEHMSD